MGEEGSLKHSLIICCECSGVMQYKGAGTYVCEHCGHEELDDYGVVRRFLEKRGPSNIFEIAEGTGLNRSVISGLFKEGRLEVAKSSAVAVTCARCGMPIRSGEYCSKCDAEMKALGERNKKKGIYNVLKEGGKDDGKMRFLGDE